MIGKIIGRVVSAEAFARAFKVAPAKRAAKAPATQSVEEAILASIKAMNKPRNRREPQWGRKLVGAYERGEHGILKHTEGGRTRFIVIGRLTEKLPNIG